MTLSGAPRNIPTSYPPCPAPLPNGFPFHSRGPVSAFDGFKARLDRLFAEQTARPDARARAADIREALVEGRTALAAMREGIVVSERELAAEAKALADAERRGRLAAAVPDAETVQVAERFATRHRDRLAMLERKRQVQRDELALAEREVSEMTAQFRDARQGSAGGADAAWRDLEAAGGVRPDTDLDGALLQDRADRAAREQAADAQLAYLKKKLGKA